MILLPNNNIVRLLSRYEIRAFENKIARSFTNVYDVRLPYLLGMVNLLFSLYYIFDVIFVKLNVKS